MGRIWWRANLSAWSTKPDLVNRSRLTSEL
jgi:hypothetical protein